MGMDVMGLNATSETGSYFRNNVWWWRPLWDYCMLIGKDIIPDDNLGHSNDGWGLDAVSSRALASLLQAEIDSGRCLAYQIQYEKELAEMPDEECELCAGTGVRDDDIGKKMGQHTKYIQKEGHPRNGMMGWCNGCDGTGHKRPFQTNYPFHVENVQEFVEFLRDCGGFSIH